MIFELEESGQGGHTVPFFLSDAMPAYLIQLTYVEKICRHDKPAHRAMTDELLPEVTVTSHPPTPQLTDAACAESLSLLLNPEFEPATAPAGDTSNQAPHWLVCTFAKRDYSQRTWRNFVQLCFFYQQII